MKPFFSDSQKIIAYIGAAEGLPYADAGTLFQAVKDGADVLYIKALCTKDNTIILSEKDEVGTDGDNNSNIIATGKKYTMLFEILMEFPHQRFIIEFNEKRIDSIKSFCTIIESARAVDRVMVYSIYEKPLKRIGKFMPHMARAVSLYGVLGVYALFRMGLLYFKRKLKSDAILIPESIGMSYIGNSGFIRECRMKGVRVYVYTDNKKKQVERLSDIGIQGFITRDVSSTKKILNEFQS